MARQRENREARNPQALTETQLAEFIHNSHTDNQTQRSNAPRTGRTRRARRGSSTHSLPAYAKEPSASEQVILRSV
jgi:hypothetical protein